MTKNIRGTRRMRWSRHLCFTMPVFALLGALPAHALTFTVNSVSASRAGVQPGQTVQFAATVTANGQVSDYTIGLQVFLNGTIEPWPVRQLFQGLTFQRNEAIRQTSSWTIPAGTSSGEYERLAGAWDSQSSQWYRQTGEAAYFTVDAAWAVNGACGSASGVGASTAPTSGLCGASTASAVAGSGPWSWSCAGNNGGATASCSAPTLAATPAETPGLSSALSASPPYTCVTNYYVDAVNGNDANPGTQAAPWKTIQNAEASTNKTKPQAGGCVNVLPGTYRISNTLIFSHGGKGNTPTGYVVYRSTVPQGAHIIAGQAWSTFGGDMIMLWVPYIVVDGFEIDGNNSLAAGQGINGCADGGGYSLIAHHFIAINNIIHDMGGAGLSSCHADYITWKHNVVYNTSSTSLFQVSGIDLWEPEALAAGSYTPTAADNVPFGITISYNIARNNGEGSAVPAPHTDGNGIIVDTTLGSSTCPTCGTAYPGNILVLGNLAYDNGGGGIHVFLSENVTVADNTVYNNFLDPLNPGTLRGELSNGGSKNVTWVDNIAIAVPGSGILTRNEPIVTFPVGSFPDSGSWTKNIAFGAPVTSDATSYVNPATNLIGVNPQMTNPAGGNFVPLAGSPALGRGQPESYIPSPTSDIGAY
jgi:parallel beta-helix repeat protein